MEGAIIAVLADGVTGGKEVEPISEEVSCSIPILFHASDHIPCIHAIIYHRVRYRTMHSGCLTNMYCNFIWRSRLVGS
jgi:hypothetical protein